MPGQGVGVDVQEAPVVAEPDARDDWDKTAGDQRVQHPHVGIGVRDADALQVHHATVSRAVWRRD